MTDGKYGDQKYLDSFQEKFNNVHIISHIGSGVAPWNISQYMIEMVNDNVIVGLRKDLNSKFHLIFYHYQGLKFKDDGKYIIAEPSLLKIPEQGLKYIYSPYITQLTSIKCQIDESHWQNKEIIFQRKLLKSIGIFIRINLRGYGFIRTIYYLLKKSRYNQPKKIGATVE